MHGGARGLGRYGGGGGDQPFHALQFDLEVLAARGAHLVVQQDVAVDLGEVGGDQVLGGQGRQNTDHHDTGGHLGGLAVGIAQAGAEFFGELIEDPSGQPVRQDIDFQIALGQFSLEITARDALQDLGVHHPRQPVGTGEIQFDLQPHQVLGAVEPLLVQESPQSRQTLPQLSSIALRVGEVDPARRNLLPHRSVPPRDDGPGPAGLPGPATAPGPPVSPAAPGDRATVDDARQSDR